MVNDLENNYCNLRVFFKDKLRIAMVRNKYKDFGIIFWDQWLNEFEHTNKEEIGREKERFSIAVLKPSDFQGCTKYNMNIS